MRRLGEGIGRQLNDAVKRLEHAQTNAEIESNMPGSNPIDEVEQKPCLDQ